MFTKYIPLFPAPPAAKLESCVNGWNVNPETDRFVYEENNDLSLKDLWTIVAGIQANYDIDEKWLSKKFNIPITGVKKVQTQANTTAQGGGSIFANFR